MTRHPNNGQDHTPRVEYANELMYTMLHLASILGPERTREALDNMDTESALNLYRPPAPPKTKPASYIATDKEIDRLIAKEQARAARRNPA